MASVNVFVYSFHAFALWIFKTIKIHYSLRVKVNSQVRETSIIHDNEQKHASWAKCFMSGE